MLRRLRIRLTARLLLVTFFSNGCKNSVSSIAEFNSWLNKQTNGCIAQKRVGGIEISVKYLPPAYLALKEIENNKSAKGSILADSVLATKKSNFCFLMSLAPDVEGRGKRHSVMYQGVENFNEYAQRVMAMNFSMEKFITMYVDGKQYSPVLCLAENVYELSDKRDLLVMFVDSAAGKLYHGSEYLFIYNDPFFSTGKTQLLFSGTDLEKARDIKIGM